MNLSEAYQNRILELAGIPSCSNFYHVSDVSVRKSIILHGIDYKKGISPWDSPSDPINYPKGNYLWSTLKEAIKYAQGLSETFDIWIVCIPIDNKIEDPVTKGGFYTTDVIKPNQIRLVKTIGPDTDKY